MMQSPHSDCDPSGEIELPRANLPIAAAKPGAFLVGSDDLDLS